MFVPIAFDNTSVEQRRMILSTLIDKVVVLDDNVEVEMSLTAAQYLQLAS